MQFTKPEHIDRDTLIDILQVEDPDLVMEEKHLGFHSLNTFSIYNSSQRLVMLGNHLQQLVPLLNGEEKMIQSGMEYQLGKVTYSRMIENDSIILNVIDRYGGYSDDAIPATETVVIFYDKVKEEIDMLNIPVYFSVHPTWFGFEYARNHDVLRIIKEQKEVEVEGGTILADTPTKGPLGEYKFGLNANTLLLTMPEVSEDAVVISESFAQKLAYKIFERRTISFGKKMYPINLYGDLNNYKIFPDIGEPVADAGVLMALRNRNDGSYTDIYSIAMSSRRSLQEYDTRFDKVYYVRSPGGKLNILGKEYTTGTVMDIEAYMNPSFKNKADSLPFVQQSFEKYYNGCKQFYQDIIYAVQKIKADKRFRNVNLSNHLNNYYYRCLALYNQNGKIRYINRNLDMDTYHLEFVIQHTIIPTEGSKITDMQGCKSVIGKVLPDDQMPIDQYGNVADIIACPTAPFNRMNLGRLYEQYINAMTIEVSKKVRTGFELDEVGHLNQDTEISNIKEAFRYVVDYLSYIEGTQYEHYKDILEREDIGAMTEVIEEICRDKLYLYIKSDMKKGAPLILKDILDSPYAIEKKPILLREGGVHKWTERPAIIAPIYHILLCKTPDEISACLAPRVNTFKFPVKNLGEHKNTQFIKIVATRMLSETDKRIVVGYLPLEIVAGLRMMSNGTETPDRVYKAFLNAPEPTNIDQIINRDEVPYEMDSAVKLVFQFFNAMGIDIQYVPDKRPIHDPNEEWAMDMILGSEE